MTQILLRLKFVCVRLCVRACVRSCVCMILSIYDFYLSIIITRTDLADLD